MFRYIKDKSAARIWLLTYVVAIKVTIAWVPYGPLKHPWFEVVTLTI